MESTGRVMTQTPPQRKGDPDDKEFMTTLAKGLAVLGAFGRQRPTMTLSEAAAVADLSRATARRVLRTLTQLGYVEQDGRTFSLSPRILDLGFAYLSTQSWIDRALPLMRELSERLGESCSAAILQGNDIVYVARVPARRIMSAALSVGSRLPALHTALGRDHVRLSRRRRDLAAAASRNASRPTRRRPSPTCRRCSIASAPIASSGFPSSTKSSSAACARWPCRCSIASGQAVGAINLSTHSTRTTRNEMREQFLPELNRIAEQISSMTV